MLPGRGARGRHRVITICHTDRTHPWRSGPRSGTVEGVNASHTAGNEAERDADVVVIGAGVVGLAVAERLSRRATVVVVERRESFALETSSHNTGIVHAGMFYETGSMKHRLCVAGNPLVYEWCEMRGVRIARTGKLIVALDDAERDGLDAVAERAEANDVPGMRPLTQDEARDVEPRVPAIAALFSETSGIVDQYEYARSLEAAAREHGALFAYHHQLVAAERDGAGFRLSLRDESGTESELRCGVLVCAAGHGAPGVAEALGYPLDGDEQSGVPPLRQRVNRGRYYDFANPELARAVSRPVYPVPSGGVSQRQANAGGLGLHLSVDIDGIAHLGPDTEWLEDGAPLDYLADDTRREAFLAAGRRFLPELTAADLVPGQVGYRPKLVAQDGRSPDFLVWLDRGYLHLGGIESPGLTSSLAIARHAEGLLAG
jgi:L-2-hydroxyglutarate oxidase LhgO